MLKERQETLAHYNKLILIAFSWMWYQNDKGQVLRQMVILPSLLYPKNKCMKRKPFHNSIQRSKFQIKCMKKKNKTLIIWDSSKLLFFFLGWFQDIARIIMIWVINISLRKYYDFKNISSLFACSLTDIYFCIDDKSKINSHVTHNSKLMSQQ